MANICAFRIEACGDPCQLQALKQFLERGVKALQNPAFEKYALNIACLYDDLEENEHRFVWLDDSQPGSRYDQMFVSEAPFWFSADHTRLLLHGTSRWAPPGPLVERLSKAFPDLDFSFGGTTEHEISESWTCKAGTSKCEWYVVLDIQSEQEMWIVKDGQQVPPVERTDSDLEELTALEARVDEIMER